ncbi:hypothetical protein DOTSEDRAFT_27336 [Dothistroma septosporum NZE10]|uniref:Uncharacterized protein n=1 Tax=Dothistroma septosporum (strain NZE10 / CBS 128990) TaxID=675120 RepID=N1PF58_DOTSN|nr:hypothetical protein DOTSEDRAFT_27336 [Dothistroma septosporum NZE10]
MSATSSNKEKRSKEFTKVSGSDSAQHTSRLLKLPAELRNRIYRFALHGQMAYKLRKTTKCKRLHTVKPQAPGLLLACRQTHIEAIRMLYQQAHIIFDHLDILKKWTKKIGSNRLQLIGALHLKSSVLDFKQLVASYWSPRWTLTAYAIEAQAALEAAKSELDIDHIVLKTDVYMPGRMVDIVWTEKSVDLAAKFSENADDTALPRQNWQAFEMLRQDRAQIWE